MIKHHLLLSQSQLKMKVLWNLRLNFLAAAAFAIPNIPSIVESATLNKVSCNSNGACYCPENPLTERYPDPQDEYCEHYYLCHLGRAFKKKCDVRTAFHPQVGECMPRQRIPERICPFPVSCPTWMNRYVEDREDCTKYYLCFYQRPSHYGCPEGNYFDPHKEKCIHDVRQTEDCQNQALSNKGNRLNIPPPPEKTSYALSQTKLNAGAYNRTRSSGDGGGGKPSGAKAFAISFGKLFHG